MPSDRQAFEDLLAIPGVHKYRLGGDRYQVTVYSRAPGGEPVPRAYLSTLQGALAWILEQKGRDAVSGGRQELGRIVEALQGLSGRLWSAARDKRYREALKALRAQRAKPQEAGGTS